MHYKLINSITKREHLAEALTYIAFLISLTHLLTLPTQAENIKLIFPLSHECFSSKERQLCLKAIEKIEEFQIIRGLQKDFACQTRLLGLQSKLIMVVLNKQKRPSFDSDMKDVKRFCIET